MKIPQPRGIASSLLLELLAGNDPSHDLQGLNDAATEALAATDILYAEDLQLCLFSLYELHYGGFETVSDNWEWHPGLLAFRARLEAAFETRLREAVGDIGPIPDTAEQVAAKLFELANSASGPSVSEFVSRHASVEQVQEFLIQKSIYQLKEADPHTWAIPRLSGRGKSALVEIQFDEYGSGRPGAMHSELFAKTMAGLDLNSEFGAYIDAIPAITLASVNMMSLFGLHRRMRGAIAGHLAIYEMTSSIPSSRYARGLRRLGFGSPVTDYFDEHVEADAVHEQIAGRDLAGGLIEADPGIGAEIFFGAHAVCFIDDLLGRWQLDAWSQGHSSLRTQEAIK
ncbi:iron-containing redox enzyme family protein [Glutamicibacter arilaitensis]|uniref:iron-containing redox enzyme family protein n=1 Tax=Glutamicibacter arilaitensis TaxID=256701 RepID=UPI00384BE1F4